MASRFCRRKEAPSRTYCGGKQRNTFFSLPSFIPSFYFDFGITFFRFGVGYIWAAFWLRFGHASFLFAYVLLIAYHNTCIFIRATRSADDDFVTCLSSASVSVWVTVSLSVTFRFRKHFQKSFGKVRFRLRSHFGNGWVSFRMCFSCVSVTNR